MRLLWRLALRQFLRDLKGKGAQLYGGRWNAKGAAVVYAAGSPEQACRYLLRHLGAAFLKLQLFGIRPIYVPGGVSVKVLSTAHLPSKWMDPKVSCRIGSAWLKSRETCVLCVPSASILGLHDYLLNPEHPDYKKVIWLPIEHVTAEVMRAAESLAEARRADDAVTSQDMTQSPPLHDVFVCHASEDKEAIVNPLLSALDEAGVTYWYDRNQIKWGDSIIEKVNDGLGRSRYLIAVVSENFLRKSWPKREMNAALNIEASLGRTRVLLLLVGGNQERKRILEALALQNDKLYQVWNGDPRPVVNALVDRLLTA